MHPTNNHGPSYSQNTYDSDKPTTSETTDKKANETNSVKNTSEPVDSDKVKTPKTPITQRSAIHREQPTKSGTASQTLKTWDNKLADKFCSPLQKSAQKVIDTLIKKSQKKQGLIPIDGNLMHLGCRNGANIEFLRNAFQCKHLLAYDSDPKILESAKGVTKNLNQDKNNIYVTSNIIDVQNSASKFKTAISIQYLHWLPPVDLEEKIQTVANSLEDGGYFILHYSPSKKGLPMWEVLNNLKQGPDYKDIFENYQRSKYDHEGSYVRQLLNQSGLKVEDDDFIVEDFDNPKPSKEQFKGHIKNVLAEFSYLTDLDKKSPETKPLAEPFLNAFLDAYLDKVGYKGNDENETISWVSRTVTIIAKKDG